MNEWRENDIYECDEKENCAETYPPFELVWLVNMNDYIRKL